MDDRTSLLLTDLYQLNMMQAYVDHDMFDTAVFEFFVRELPPGRGFLMAAGLRHVVAFLKNAAFTPEELQWLEDSGRFEPSLLGYLADFRFTGDVHAMAEGTVFFPDEPILRVVAPLPEAQLVESRIINLLHFSTVVASKAARMVLAAPGKTLIDFGLRRAHGAEAGVHAAIASYLAGFAGSATVLANARHEVPVYGTMAHSFIQAHDDEVRAFENFARSRPQAVVLLLDTYDTEAAAHKVVELAPRLAADGVPISGVRIDSGDLVDHARRVRRILDEGGLGGVQIFASGGLDERRLLAMTRANAPIEGFGIGTSLTTSEDAPALDCAYKLQEYAGVPRRKRSEGKATWPGRKQVFRSHDRDGRMISDVLTVEDDDTAPGEALIYPVMRVGKAVAEPPSLEKSREHAADQLRRLPDDLRRLDDDAAAYPVTVSDLLRDLAREADCRSAQAPADPPQR